MTPPLPPCLVDIRFTASRAQRMLPVTLTAIIALDALGRHLVDAHAALADNAGIVDERAERAELVRGLEQRQDIALLADVAFHRDRLAVAWPRSSATTSSAAALLLA